MASILGLQPGDGGRTAAITGLHFVLGAAIVFMQAAAFGLFVAEFGAQRLPYAYLAIAVLVTALNVAYLRLSERLSFAAVSYVILIFLAAACVALWLGLGSPLRSAVIFALPAGFQTVINVTVLVVWPLAGRSFDMREAKRTFGVISGGNWLASLLIGLTIAPLAAAIGARNLLLAAALAAGLTLVLLGPVTRLARVQEPPQKARPGQPAGRNPPKPAAASPTLTALLSGPTIRPLLAYIVVLWVAYYFVDNILYERAGLLFADAALLGGFIGRIVAIYGILAAIMSLFLTGRIVTRFGVRNALLLLPSLLAFDMAALALAGALRLPDGLVLAFAAIGKILFIGVGFSLSYTALTFLYQPLPPAARARTQALAEGILQSLAIGLGGMLLLLFSSVLKFSAVGLASVTVVVSLVWIGTILAIGREYPQALSAALAQRRLGEGSTPVMDRDALALLRGQLTDRHAGVSLYALRTLEREDPAGWPATLEAGLPRLLEHDRAEVRREALAAAGRLGKAAADGNRDGSQLDPARTGAAIAEHLKSEHDPAVCAEGVSTIAALVGAEAGPLLVDQLGGDSEPERAALVALLGMPEAAGSRQAEVVLNRLVASAQPADRVRAAEVCRETRRPQDAGILCRLVSDETAAVRRAALAAAGLSPSADVWPEVVDAAGRPETSAAAESALAAGGERVLAAIETGLAPIGFPATDADRLRRQTLVRACQRIGGPVAMALSASQMDHPDLETRTLALRVLAEQGYRDGERGFAFLAPELDGATGVAAALGAVTRSSAGLEGSLLGDGLLRELREARERVLLRLSFRLDAKTMMAAARVLASDGNARRAYAFEAVETQLPAELRSRVMPLIELADPAALADRFRAAGLEFAQLDESSALAAIMGSEATDAHGHDVSLVGLHPWTQAAALHHAAVRRVESLPALVARATRSPFRLVRDTASFADRPENLPAKGGAAAMLSTIEKVLVLKRVGMFGETPDNVLADVADLCDEVLVEAAEQVIAKGEPGDSLYIVVQGRLAARDGGRVLNELVEGNVFGEMALLDPAPRAASVVALESSHLLQLAQGPFEELIQARPEVALGVIRVLARHLRARVEDVARLDSQLVSLASV